MDTQTTILTIVQVVIGGFQAFISFRQAQIAREQASIAGRQADLARDALAISERTARTSVEALQLSRMQIARAQRAYMIVESLELRRSGVDRHVKVIWKNYGTTPASVSDLALYVRGTHEDIGDDYDFAQHFIEPADAFNVLVGPGGLLESGYITMGPAVTSELERPTGRLYVFSRLKYLDVFDDDMRIVQAVHQARVIRDSQGVITGMTFIGVPAYNLYT